VIVYHAETGPASPTRLPGLLYMAARGGVPVSVSSTSPLQDEWRPSTVISAVWPQTRGPRARNGASFRAALGTGDTRYRLIQGEANAL